MSEVTTTVAQTSMEQVGQELLGWLQGTGAFVAEQAPDVANQMVTFGIWSNGAVMGVFLLTTAFCAWLGIRCFKKAADPSEGDIALAIVGIVMGILTFALMLLNAHYFIMALVAPKVYIIEHLANLVK